MKPIQIKPIPPAVRVVSREDIPLLESVVVEGKIYHLGKLHDFRKHKYLSEFLPENARLAISWVHLNNGQILETHQHPTSSMIIICEGEGEVRGAITQKLYTGDVVIVPPNQAHGFIGLGKSGFWALSIQFEGVGLYEDREHPRVEFLKNNHKLQKNDFQWIEKDQKKYKDKFIRSPLMKLLSSEVIHHESVKARLLEALNYWSDWFQRILAARVAIGGPQKFQDIAEQHLSEEAGHNKILLTVRDNKPIEFWDPMLDAVASWFYQRMFSGTNIEKTILMHLVLEDASTVFHSEALHAFPHLKHFEMHSVLDEDHVQMGIELLKSEEHLDIEEVRYTLYKGWNMFGALANRIAAFSKNGTKYL